MVFISFEIIKFVEMFVGWLFLFFVVWVFFLQIKGSYVNQEGYMFMPFDAAHWCAVSQVKLSILLCSRYHGHVTIRILLIASCKKDQGYSKSSLNLMQIHIWTTWFKGKFLIMLQKILVLFLFVCWCWWVLLIKNIWLGVN